MVIAKRNRSLNSGFIVRKISNGEGVERTFQLYSPIIAGIEVKRRGDVRRARLYHLRQRSGKVGPHQREARLTTGQPVTTPHRSRATRSGFVGQAAPPADKLPAGGEAPDVQLPSPYPRPPGGAGGPVPMRTWPGRPVALTPEALRRRFGSAGLAARDPRRHRPKSTGNSRPRPCWCRCYSAPGLRVLLTQRGHLRDHAGQISFPAAGPSR